LARLTAKTECCILKHIESCKKSQELPKKAELAECITSLEPPDVEA